MEKVLVKFDEYGFKQLQENAKASRQYVQEFIDDINAINDLKITFTHLQDLLLSDGGKTLQALIAETLKQIEKSGLKSKNLINAAVEADKQTFETLFSKFRRPEVDICRLYSLEKGKIVIDASALAAAKERFCHYIATERGLRKQTEYNAFIEAAKAFFNDNKAFKGFNFFQFFKIDDNNSIHPVEIQFDAL